jgi:hypothetical protein
VRTNQTIADFALSASEPNVDFECAFDDGDWEPCDDEPSYSGLSVETHHFKARATDRAGNLGEANVFTWTVDLTQPDAPVIDAPTEGALLTTARPSFSGHAEPGAAVELFVDGSSLGTAPANGVTGSWALTPGSSLAQGVAQVKARAIDVAGNVGEFGATRQLTIDSIAPVTTIHGAPTAPTRADTVSITFTADDPQASFSCRIDAAVYAPCASALTTPQLTEGAHTINVRAKDVAGNVELPAQQVTFTIDRTAPVGQSVLVAGSAGSDGIPGFQIASDDPIATARCKLDNGPFVTCSGQYKPTATAGLHALTIRFTDVAGNSDDQVFAFNVVPAAAPTTPPASASTPPANNDEAPRAKVCKVLGAAGLTTGRMRITGASGSGRALTLTLSAGTPGIVQVDALAGAATLGSAPFAVKSGSNKLSLKLTRAPAAGSALGLAVRFYSVKREFGTARLSLAVKGSTLKPAAGAQSTLDVTCPVTSGDAAGAKFSAAGAKVGSGGFKLSSSSKRPAVVALKVFRSGSSLPIANTIFAIGAGKQTSTVKLLGGAELARDGYKFTFDALGPGGRESAGRGAFIAR